MTTFAVCSEDCKVSEYRLHRPFVDGMLSSAKWTAKGFPVAFWSEERDENTKLPTSCVCPGCGRPLGFNADGSPKIGIPYEALEKAFYWLSEQAGPEMSVYPQILREKALQAVGLQHKMGDKNTPLQNLLNLKYQGVVVVGQNCMGDGYYEAIPAYWDNDLKCFRTEGGEIKNSRTGDTPAEAIGRLAQGAFGETLPDIMDEGEEFLPYDGEGEIE